MSTVLDISTAVLYRPYDAEPIDARLTLGDRLAVENETFDTEIDLSTVFDIRVGPPPRAAADAFDRSVLTIGFDGANGREVLFVDGTEATLDNVAGVLYRRLLDGLEVAISHPAKIGGRVTEKSYEIGTLLVAPGKVGCRQIDSPFSIDLPTIVGFSLDTETLLGEGRSVITIRYVKRGIAVSLKLSLSQSRKRHLLGRFLRRDYDRIRDRLTRLDLPGSAYRALVRLYSLRGTAPPARLETAPEISVEALLRGLLRAELVEINDDGEVGLTPRGWILVTEHVGDEASTLDPDL